MSTNIKWAYQKRFKEGEVLINYQGTLGYTKIDGQYVIVEEEAEIIRRIFREYIGGATLKRIGQRLTDEGIQTPGGKAVWQPSAVQGILKNEKYTGNAILGKTYKPDVLSKTRLENKGQAPSYYVKNSHPAIVSEETYNIVQSEMERRKDLRSSAKTGDGKYSSKYALSGLLVCSECGSKFRRFRRGLADRTVVITWVCIQHQKNIQECRMLPLKEEDILDAYKRVMSRLAGDVSEVIQTVKETIESELAPSQTETTAQCDDEIVNCQKKVLELFKLKRENGITPREYEARYKEYSDRIISLQAEQIELQKRDASAQLARQRIIEINEVLNNADKINSTDESIMKMLLDCIKVISKNEIEFQFKCGTTIKEEI